MKLYLQTTTISVSKTLAEVDALLGDMGARRIMRDMDGAGRVTRLCFSLACGDAEIPFTLPARFDGVLRQLRSQRSPRTRDRMLDEDKRQAERICWRQILAWLRAQWALIQAGMSSAEEVMMPYQTLPSGQTFFEAYRERGAKALPILDE